MKSWYYVALVGDLAGLYVAFLAPDERAVKKYCETYMGKMWGDIYAESQYTSFELDHRMINSDKPIELDPYF